jgi:hypothetical protein
MAPFIKQQSPIIPTKRNLMEEKRKARQELQEH